jgi:hypothetical protein
VTGREQNELDLGGGMFVLREGAIEIVEGGVLRPERWVLGHSQRCLR